MKNNFLFVFCFFVACTTIKHFYVKLKNIYSPSDIKRLLFNHFSVAKSISAFLVD